MSVMLEALWQDLGFAARSLSRRPGFTFVAMTTLALGIGATSAIFSVVNGVVLRPLPYPDSRGLVSVEVSWRPSGGTGTMSYPDLADAVSGSDELESLVGYATERVALTGFGEPRIVQTAQLTGGLLASFRLSPALGRDIRGDEFGSDAAAVVMVSHAFWRQNLGGDPDALGRTIELDGTAYQVVGVAPEGFGFPEDAELWLPRRIDLQSCARGCHTWLTVGRLSAGATLEGAQAALDRVASALRRAYPDSNANTYFSLSRLQDHMVGDVARGLWLLLGAVGLVLLIASANVANLLLVRAASRTGEVAVRTALGAGRTRLKVQLLAESGLLAIVGGGVGVAVAYGATGLLRRVSPGTIPRIDEVGVDGGVLLFAAGLVVAVTVLFGLLPALRPASAPLQGRLAHSSSHRGDRSRSFLLATEVSLCLVLLVGAGLLLRTLGALHAVDLGFETRQVVRFTLSLPEARYEALPQMRSFYRTLEARVRALPGVDEVGSIHGAPLSGTGSSGDVLVEDRPTPPAGQIPGAAIRAVSPRYLQTVRIPLVSGRYLDPTDDENAEPVAVVNQTFVDRLFPGENPLGRSIRVTVSEGFGSPYWRIVGVVGNVRSSSLTRKPYAEVYVPHGQFGAGYMTVTVRGAPGARSLLPALREEVRALDADLPLISPERLTDAVSRQVAPTRFYLSLFVLFAVLAVVLAGVGLYGVVAYLVSRRTREIGLRIALGARHGAVVRMVVAQGLRPAGVGISIGLLVSLWGVGILDSLLYGVTARDPWIFVGVVAVVSGLVLLGSWLPARNVSRIDPREALRAE